MTLLRDYWADVLRVMICSLISCISSLTTVLRLATPPATNVPGHIVLWAGDRKYCSSLPSAVPRHAWIALAQASVHCGLLAVPWFPYFLAISTGNSTLIFIAASLLSGVVYAATAHQLSFLERCSERVRYSGMAIGTNFGFLAAGPLGYKPEPGGAGPGWIPVAIFIACCCTAAAIAGATARETSHTPLEQLGKANLEPKKGPR